MPRKRTLTQDRFRGSVKPDTPEAAIVRLLALCGSESVCKGADCGETIWWVTSKHGRRTPINGDGVQHVHTCPNAKDFKNKGTVSNAMGKTTGHAGQTEVKRKKGYVSPLDRIEGEDLRNGVEPEPVD